MKFPVFNLKLAIGLAALWFSFSAMASPLGVGDPATAMAFQARAPGGISSTLTNGLVFYYTLANTSDSLGVQNLTNNNVVTFSTGKVGNAANFNGSNQYLNVGDNPAISCGEDTAYTIAAWVKTTDSGGKFILGKNSTIANFERSSFAFRIVSGVPDFSNGNGTTGTNVVWGSTINDGSWHLLIGWHDPVADTINISVDDGTPVSQAWSGGTYDSTYNFGIGNCGTAATSRYLNGSVDEVALAFRVWTSGERTEFYNAGTGKTLFP